MGGLFHKPKTPAPIKVKSAPSTSSASTQAALDKAAQEEAARLQRGRAATLLTGGAGLKDRGTTSKVLLGQ